MSDPEHVDPPSDGPVVVLVGAGALGGELAAAAVRQEARVAALDWDTGDPAQAAAHQARVLAATDPASIAEAVHPLEPALVLLGPAAGTPEVAQALEEGGLRVVPSSRALRLTADREAIRQMARDELEIPAPEYRVASSEDEVRAACEALGYPAVVKRVRGPSGRGQSVVTGPARVEQAWGYARRGPGDQAPRVIVEELIEFDGELTVLAAGSGDRLVTSEVIEHRHERGGFRESWSPAEVGEAVAENARQTAREVARHLGSAGVVAVRFFVVGGDLVFSEVSTGPHETGLVTLVGQEPSQFDFHVRAALGREPGPVHGLGYAAAAGILARDEGTVTGLKGVDRACKVQGVRVVAFGRPRVRPTDRVGVALATGGSLDEARARALEAAARIDVVIE